MPFIYFIYVIYYIWIYIIIKIYIYIIYTIIIIYNLYNEQLSYTSVDLSLCIQVQNIPVMKEAKAQVCEVTSKYTQLWRITVDLKIHLLNPKTLLLILCLLWVTRLCKGVISDEKYYLNAVLLS